MKSQQQKNVAEEILEKIINSCKMSTHVSKQLMALQAG